jgi:hypothetical protein
MNVMDEVDAGKRDKSSVDYGPAKPGGTEKCEWCRYFMPDLDKCRRVKGAIAPSDWCNLFQRKRGSYASRQ